MFSMRPFIDRNCIGLASPADSCGTSAPVIDGPHLEADAGTSYSSY